MQYPSVFLAVMGTFLIAGIVKGVIGLGSHPAWCGCQNGGPRSAR